MASELQIKIKVHSGFVFMFLTMCDHVFYEIVLTLNK